METSNGSGSISIQLEPKHLGKIKFKVSLKNNKVSAELSVSLSQTKEILELQLPDIRRSLVQHGIEVTELNVSLENGSLESDLRHSNLFRGHGDDFRGSNSSAAYEQEEERESSEQRDTTSDVLVDLLI
jgi:flagellar hook-length control protein FliK